MPVNRRSPEWRKITPFAGLDILYGFRSRTLGGDQAELGQTAIAPAQDFSKLVIAPNNCQPHSATKRTATGSSNGLIGADKIDAAVSSGKWKIKWGYPPRTRKPKGENKNIKIVMGTVNFGYIRAADALYDQLASFGHKTPDATDNGKLFYGAQFPVPPKLAVTTTAGKSVSSYADPSKIDDIVGAGGRLIHPGAYTAVHLANMVAVEAAP